MDLFDLKNKLKSTNLKKDMLFAIQFLTNLYHLLNLQKNKKAT